MTEVLHIVLKDYDYLSPLVCGDISTENDLHLVRDTPRALRRALEDPDLAGGELSFGRHLIRLDSGNREFVAIPFFAVRGFRHRCFYVSADSSMTDLADLTGTRVGTNEWPASGNIWSRAALREGGVDIDRIEWVVGPVNAGDPFREQGVLPENVSTTDGAPLAEQLDTGQIGAVMSPVAPRGFGEPGGPRRLIEDYRAAEQTYFRRTHVYPGHHIVGIRRDIWEQAPGVLSTVFRALENSRTLWMHRKRQLPEWTPWLETEMETTTELLGSDWHPSGIHANRQMIELFVREMQAQRLIGCPISPEEIFAEYLEVDS